MILSSVVAAVVVVLMLGVGAWMTTVGPWYRDLHKPAWNPPDWIFGPAWTVILALAGWAGVSAWTNASSSADRFRILALFGINVVLHMLWSPLFFNLRRPDWALIEVPFLWLSIVALMVGLAHMSSLSVWLLCPYLLWVTFAAFSTSPLSGSMARLAKILSHESPTNLTTAMCNLYSITTNQAAISALFRVVNRYVGNLAPMPGVFPDYKAPIVRAGADGRELATARWGMPSSAHALMEATKKRAAKLEAKGKLVDFKELLRMEPDSGTTNIRNLKSKHWTRWLGPEHRCVVPFNSFSEFNKAEGGDVWFALDETRPLACFAGIWTNWTSVRKVREGETTNDLYAFLTTEPNAEVGAVHPKAMPVILTTPDEVETWMTAPADEALKLQRPLPDGALRIVARGVKEDPAGSAA